MKTLMNLRGIVTVLNTPFSEDDKLDLGGLRKNTEYAIEAGVSGFLVPAMASEVGKLTEAERDVIVRNVVETAAGRVTVIGGASAAEQGDRLRMARRLTELGCDGILVSIPCTDEQQYETAVRQVAETNPGFLMIQDWDASGPGLAIDLIVRLFDEIPLFRCLKIETVPAGLKYSEVLKATGGRLHVSGGWAVTQMIEGLERGVHAFMPTGMHRIYTTIYRLYVEGQRDEAQRLFHEVAPVLAFSNQHLDLSIHFFKRLLHAQGIYATSRVRPPILPYDAIHERLAAQHIAKVMALEAKLLRH